MGTSVIRAEAVRVTTSPNAVMTTLASPTLSGSDGMSMWRAEFKAGASGPVHAFDSEQLWTLLSGEASFTVGDEEYQLAAGDTIQLAADVERQVRALTDVEFVVTGRGTAKVDAHGFPAHGQTPAWIS